MQSKSQNIGKMVLAQSQKLEEGAFGKNQKLFKMYSKKTKILGKKKGAWTKPKAWRRCLAKNQKLLNKYLQTKSRIIETKGKILQKKVLAQTQSLKKVLGKTSQKLLKKVIATKRSQNIDTCAWTNPKTWRRCLKKKSQKALNRWSCTKKGNIF